MEGLRSGGARRCRAIREQEHRRYGLDVDDLGADDGSIATVMAKAERYREQAGQERRTGRDETSRLPIAGRGRPGRPRPRAERRGGEPTSQTLAEEAAPLWGSAGRRQELADGLERLSGREAALARLSADQDQTTPPTPAVTKASGHSPKSRKKRCAHCQTKLLQKGMSRQRDLPGSSCRGVVALGEAGSGGAADEAVGAKFVDLGG